MPAVVLSLPSEYPYVALAAVSTFWLTSWQGFVVGSKRSAAGIKYPQMYAEAAQAAASPAAFTFNCAQRAHQNTLETLPHILWSVLFTGLVHPKLAAGLGFTWTVGRILYTFGYLAGPETRGKRGGFLSSIAMLGLLLSSTYSGVMMLREIL